MASICSDDSNEIPELQNQSESETEVRDPTLLDSSSEEDDNSVEGSLDLVFNPFKSSI